MLKEECMLTASHQIENIHKEVEIVFERNKVEVLELESIITKMKNSLKGLNCRSELPE